VVLRIVLIHLLHQVRLLLKLQVLLIFLLSLEVAVVVNMHLVEVEVLVE